MVINNIIMSFYLFHFERLAFTLTYLYISFFCFLGCSEAPSQLCVNTDVNRRVFKLTLYLHNFYFEQASFHDLMIPGLFQLLYDLFSSLLFEFSLKKCIQPVYTQPGLC